MELFAHPHCCPVEVSRRNFLGGLGGITLSASMRCDFSWAEVAAASRREEPAPDRRPLAIKPILTYEIPARRPQTSWRSWGGIQTQGEADAETARIRSELELLKKRAEFPLEILPVSGARRREDIEALEDLGRADVVLLYAAGGSSRMFDAALKGGKDAIFFLRHKSGPVYLWYEIVSPRYLRQHTDAQALAGIRDQDVVVDNQDEILWRLRSLAGLRNTLGTRILAIGGAGAWAQPKDVVPTLVRKLFRFDIQNVSYEDLGRLIKEAKGDAEAVRAARDSAAAYLGQPRTRLETKPEFVESAFLLEQIFRALMKKAECRAITINGCMGTIMPLAETSACLTLSRLNDAGYLAFCESDFVVIPSGVLIANISGRPMFLNDPTYPHDGLITLAHCTAPRRLDGKSAEPVRLLTHFESDYGAAPKVEMRKGQKVTNIIPDFAFKRWLGLIGEIVDSPFMPICRSQIDIRFSCDSRRLAERMPGFHWMSVYGDYMREIGYALSRIPIEWEVLS